MRISDWSSDVCSSDLGYDLLRHKRPADAVTVFGLLTRAYPGKANSYDSLADGYEALGKREDAIAAMRKAVALRSEEHTSELQSLMRSSYAVFCLKKKNKQHTYHYRI